MLPSAHIAGLETRLIEGGEYGGVAMRRYDADHPNQLREWTVPAASTATRMQAQRGQELANAVTDLHGSLPRSYRLGRDMHHDETRRGAVGQGLRHKLSPVE